MKLFLFYPLTDISYVSCGETAIKIRVTTGFSEMLELFGTQLNTFEGVELSQANLDVAGKFGYSDVCNPMASICVCDCASASFLFG